LTSDTWCDTERLNKYKKIFGKSDSGNFEVMDTIPVPHAYMITPKHLIYNKNEMYLGDTQIERMESEHGSLCGQIGCNLRWAEHKQALLVKCLTSFKSKDDPKKMNEELYEWLLKCKPLVEKNSLEGFAFMEMNKNAC